MGMDNFFLARATELQHAKAVLNCLDFQSGAVFSAMAVKGGDPYAQAVALEAIKFTGRTRLIIMGDQENAVKNLVEMVRGSRAHETIVINTPKGSSASVGGIDGFRGFGAQGVDILGASQCVADYAPQGEVRWEDPVREASRTTVRRLGGRAEFAEVVHFWSPGLWLGKSLASDEHYVGTSAGVRRCRCIWRLQRVSAGARRC